MSFDEGQYEDNQAFQCAKCGGVITFDDELEGGTWVCDNCLWSKREYDDIEERALAQSACPTAIFRGIN